MKTNTQKYNIWTVCTLLIISIYTKYLLCSVQNDKESGWLTAA